MGQDGVNENDPVSNTLEDLITSYQSVMNTPLIVNNSEIQIEIESEVNKDTVFDCHSNRHGVYIIWQ